jgi:hypothetical protein
MHGDTILPPDSDELRWRKRVRYDHEVTLRLLRHYQLDELEKDVTEIEDDLWYVKLHHLFQLPVWLECEPIPHVWRLSGIDLLCRFTASLIYKKYQALRLDMGPELNCGIVFPLPGQKFTVCHDLPLPKWSGATRFTIPLSDTTLTLQPLDDLLHEWNFTPEVH